MSSACESPSGRADQDRPAPPVTARLAAQYLLPYARGRYVGFYEVLYIYNRYYLYVEVYTYRLYYPRQCYRVVYLYYCYTTLTVYATYVVVYRYPAIGPYSLYQLLRAGGYVYVYGVHRATAYPPYYEILH